MVRGCWEIVLPMRRTPLVPVSIWKRLSPPALAWRVAPPGRMTTEQVSGVHVPLSCACAIAVLANNHTVFGEVSWSRAIARSPPSKDSREQSAWRLNLEVRPEVEAKKRM